MFDFCIACKRGSRKVIQPFNFPAPLVKIKDLNFSLTEFPRYVGVWKTSDLKKHVESKK